MAHIVVLLLQTLWKIMNEGQDYDYDNVLWQWYLPGGSLEKNLLLNEVYVYFMGEKSTRNRIYMCDQKDKICVGLVNRCEYLCHKWPRTCFVCRNHNPVLHSWFFTGFITRVPRCVPLVEQELLTLKKHMSSPLVSQRLTRPTHILSFWSHK
jgi:hypothetical protein